MANKKVSFLFNIVMPILVVLTTITIFYIFKPEEAENLFFFNLIYAIILEAIFFTYLGLLQSKTKTFSTPFYAIMGIFALFYVIIGALWMIVYSSAFTQIISFKFYYISIIILTVLWNVVAMLITKTDSDYKETVDDLKTRQNSLQYYSQQLDSLANRYKNICREKNIVYKTDSNNNTPLDRLKAKMNFLTPNIFNNESASMQLKAIIEQCTEIVDEMEKAESTLIDQTQIKMNQFIDKAMNDIDLLKTLTRK